MGTVGFCPVEPYFGVMSDSSEAGESDAARMKLEPKTVHEEDAEGEPYLDCPACGASVTFIEIIETGRCGGELDDDAAEAPADDTSPREAGCGAELSLELVWEA